MRTQFSLLAARGFTTAMDSQTAISTPRRHVSHGLGVWLGISIVLLAIALVLLGQIGWLECLMVCLAALGLYGIIQPGPRKAG